MIGALINTCSSAIKVKNTKDNFDEIEDDYQNSMEILDQLVDTISDDDCTIDQIKQKKKNNKLFLETIGVQPN